MVQTIISPRELDRAMGGRWLSVEELDEIADLQRKLDEARGLLKDMLDHGGPRGTWDAGKFLRTVNKAEAFLTPAGTDGEEGAKP